MDENKEIGKINISEDVVSIISSVATLEVPGVKDMSVGLSEGIAEIIGKKPPSKGVKVEILDDKVILDLKIIVEYGCRIPEVAWNVQEKVKQAVETMTGLNVIKVNIHIQGVNFEDKTKEDKTKKVEEIDTE
jgi:uncharacterized alkaline shock family protein YloU